jgi:DMSO reductase anchor subunit
MGLVCMASIYGRTAMPAWGMAHTHVNFFATTVALGTSLFLVLATLWASPLPAVRPSAFLIAGATLLQAMDWWQHPHALRHAARILTVRALGLTCSLAGGAGLLLLAVKIPWTASPWLYVSILCLVVGQGLLRYVYFARGVHAMAEGWANIAYQPGQRLTRASGGTDSWVGFRR